MVALCGLSGSGKSTVASLIERFYDVDSGRITIDELDVERLNPAWIRGDLVGYINQVNLPNELCIPIINPCLGHQCYSIPKCPHFIILTHKLTPNVKPCYS